MKEYIEKEKALEIIKRTQGDYAAAFSEVRKLPAADVISVVRCKDCIYYIYGCCIIHSEEPDVFYPGYSFNPKPNDFCSYGEREED